MALCGGPGLFVGVDALLVNGRGSNSLKTGTNHALVHNDSVARESGRVHVV